MKTMQSQIICNKDSTKVPTSRTCITKEDRKQDHLHSKEIPQTSTAAEK